jgi:hypothetical protein
MAGPRSVLHFIMTFKTHEAYHCLVSLQSIYHTLDLRISEYHREELPHFVTLCAISSTEQIITIFSEVPWAGHILQLHTVFCFAERTRDTE